jgi:hypothetical protein
MSEQTEKLESMMRKIRAMLERADHPNTPAPEADTARRKAEAMMHKYRIEESMLAESEPEKGVVPVFREWPLYPVGAAYDTVYLSLISYIGSHVGIRIKCAYKIMGEDADGFAVGSAQVVVQAVGYDVDLRYAEFLYQSARSVFVSHMEPKVDPNLSDEENVYRLRSAGMERIKVAEMMGWVKGGAKVTRLYKAACEARGEEPVLTGKGNMMGAFRESYANHFKTEFWLRLNRAKDGVDVTAGALVLAGRKENVDEAFYNLFPEHRPDKVAKTTNKPARKARARRWTKADERRWMQSQSAAGRAGEQRGKSAAQSIDITKAGTARLEGE